MKDETAIKAVVTPRTEAKAMEYLRAVHENVAEYTPSSSAAVALVAQG